MWGAGMLPAEHGVGVVPGLNDRGQLRLEGRKPGCAAGEIMTAPIHLPSGRGMLFS